MDCCTGRNLFYALAEAAIKIFGNNGHAQFNFHQAVTLIVFKRPDSVRNGIAIVVIGVGSGQLSVGTAQTARICCG